MPVKLRVVKSFVSGNTMFHPGAIIEPGAIMREQFLRAGWCVLDELDKAVETFVKPKSPEVPEHRRKPKRSSTK